MKRLFYFYDLQVVLHGGFYFLRYKGASQYLKEVRRWSFWRLLALVVRNCFECFEVPVICVFSEGENGGNVPAPADVKTVGEQG